jgi:hypothetical protein
MRRALVSLAAIAAAVCVVATIDLTQSGASAATQPPASQPALALRAGTLQQQAAGAVTGAASVHTAAVHTVTAPRHHSPKPESVQKLQTTPSPDNAPAAASAPASVAPATPAPPVATRTTPTHETSVRQHTGWQALDDAIDQLPYWYPGVATFRVGDKGAWGATDLDNGIIWIAPRTPSYDLLSVVMHEYGHAITGRLYGGFQGAEAAADHFFGQSGEYGLEVEADCMARVEGAAWTNYTPCQNATWRAYAASLLHMKKIA